MNEHREELPVPKSLPEPGFYRHYKFDPTLTRWDCPDANIRNYTYEILPTLGFYTEESSFDSLLIDYIPLYPWAPVYVLGLKVGRMVKDDRPASMFLETVPKGPNGELIPRFQKITDAELIKLLVGIRDEMYGVFPTIYSP